MKPFFKTTHDQERGIISPPSLLHSWHWVLYTFYILLFVFFFLVKCNSTEADKSLSSEPLSINWRPIFNWKAPKELNTFTLSLLEVKVKRGKVWFSISYCHLFIAGGFFYMSEKDSSHYNWHFCFQTIFIFLQYPMVWWRKLSQHRELTDEGYISLWSSWSVKSWLKLMMVSQAPEAKYSSWCESKFSGWWIF